MGRTQEFDSEAAIDAALTVFWDKGLHRASIDDVVSATGLSRSSLYNAYGSKQALFELAVLRYVEEHGASLERALDAPTLRKGLEKLFYSAVTDNCDGRGCMLVNCAGSILREEEFEQRLLHEAFKRMLSIVQRRIREAQEAGEISRAIKPDVAATMLCASMSGLQVFHKTGMPKARLKKAATMAINNFFQQLG
jgi:TetR/AcrR family transcriptional repressor of nem operon